MPYPNQHSCRIKSPGLFKKDSFRTLHTKTKGLTLITGVLKTTNASAVQAYRYAKTNWTAERAKNHCASHKGSFEGASTKKQLALEENGKDYLTADEISAEIVKQMRPDFLYRTHMALHRNQTADSFAKTVVAHKIVANELILRKFLHHQWDKLDTI